MVVPLLPTDTPSLFFLFLFHLDYSFGSPLFFPTAFLPILANEKCLPNIIFPIFSHSLLFALIVMCPPVFNPYSFQICSYTDTLGFGIVVLVQWLFMEHLNTSPAILDSGERKSSQAQTWLTVHLSPKPVLPIDLDESCSSPDPHALEESIDQGDRPSQSPYLPLLTCSAYPVCQLPVQPAQAYFQGLCQPLPAIHPSKSKGQHAHPFTCEVAKRQLFADEYVWSLHNRAVHLHVSKASPVQERDRSGKKRRPTMSEEWVNSPFTTIF